MCWRRRLRVRSQVLQAILNIRATKGLLLVAGRHWQKNSSVPAGIVSHVGMKRPFYSYKLSTIVQASHNVRIYSLQNVLHMVNDYTGVTEIGSLFLLPDYRRDGIGKFCRAAAT